MRLKVAALSVAAAFLLALAPFTVQFQTWQYNPENFPKIVTWAGCSATVHVSDQHSPAESFYDPMNHEMYVGTREDGDIPYYAGLIILLHETGHCLQKQSGFYSPYEYRRNPVPFELEADRQSADLACSLGLDGKKLLRDTFQWAHDEFAYNGDDNHGTLAERMAMGDKAPACQKQEPQRFASL